MATTRDLFNQFLNPTTPLDQKKADLVIASDQKKANLGGLSPTDAYNLGASAQTGLGQTAMPTQEQADLLNLAPIDIITKYGQERGTALLASKYQGADAYLADALATRDVTQASGDALNQVIGGFGGAIGGVAALGTGLVSDEGGAVISETLDRFNQGLRDMRSDASNSRFDAMTARSALREQDSAQAYRDDVAAGDSSVLAGISRFGSDFAGGAVDVATDPTLFTDMTAQGVGSIAAIPAITAGMQAAVPAALAGSGARVAAQVLGANRKAVKVGRMLEGALAPTAAIGAVESGATYQETVNRVINTPFDELARTSNKFNELVASGMSQAEARTQLAGDTALQAAGTQLPAAILAGSIVSRFEAAPGASRNIKEALQNVGKEFLEEGAQSGTGQLAVNTAMASQVDPDTDVLAGVGTESGQGAVAGLGAAGVIQTRGVVANAVSDVGSVLDEQVSKLRTKNEKASPVADEAVIEAAATVQTTAPEVQAAVADSPELSQLVTEITESAINFDGESVVADESVPTIVRSAAKGQTNQIGFLQALARSSVDQSLPEADRAVALMAVKTISGQINDYMAEVNESLADLEPDHPVRKFATAINEMNNALNASPAMTASQESVETTLKAAVENNPVTETANDSAVSVQLAAAELAPQTTTAEGVNTLLKMASAGKIQLTDEQKFNLQMLSKLHQNAKEYDRTIAESGNATAQDAVSMEIKTGTTGADGSMSVMQHAQGIRQALAKGDTEDARSRLEDLGMFAQHMQNKVAAINSHMEQDNPTFQSAPSYQKLVGTRGNRSFVDSGRNKQGVTPSSETSVRHAQMVNAEANFVTKSYNSLVETFDTLGLAPMQKVELDSRLRGNAAQVASEFASGSRTAGKPKATPAPAAKPAPAKAPAPKAEVKAAPAPAPVAEVDDAFKATLSKAIAGMDNETLNRRINSLITDLLTNDNPRKAFALEAMTAERDGRVQAEVELTPEPVAEPVVEPVAEATPAPAVETEPQVAVNADLTVASANPLAEAYPTLVGGENNPFVTSYKLPMTPISKLEGVTTPISQVYNQLKNTIDDQGAIRAFQEVFRDFPNVLNYLNSNLGDLLRKKRNGKTLRELALQGDVRELTYYPEARSAALAEVNGDQIAFNTELVAKAYLAGVSWLMNGMNFIGATDIERIARAFRIPETEVTQEQVTALSNGVTRIQAIDALSNRIQQFWGVTPDGSVIDGYTKGIVQSMAANIIDAMTNMTFPMVDDQGNQVDVPVLAKTKLGISSTDNGPKSLDVFTPFSFSGTSLANYRSAIDKIVLTNPEEVVYLGSNVPAPATTQMHNPQVKNTPEQIEMLKNQNATSYYLNPETLSIYDAMGVDALVDLFGEGQLNEAVLNKNDFASREGRNLNIIASWNMAKEVIFNMQNFADDEGIELTEVPVHYAHNITSVGRAQQLGRYTPQSSKLMRTLLLPTVSKPLDLTQPGQDYTAFMLGLGQSLGVKVHNFGPDVTEAKVMDMVNGKYAPVIEILRGHLDGTGSISADNLATFKKVLGQPTFETFQGLVEYARFLNTEDKSNYVTQLYLEADGMSNGPFNSIAMLSTGKFTVDQLNNMAKCGLYLGNDNFSNVSWVKRVEDPVDLYETVSNRTKANMDIAAQAVEAQARSTNKKSANDARAYQTLQNHMNRLMGILLDDAVLVEKEDGSTELLTKRGISKNPTTVTTYGSGKAGIANKVINAMLENLYRRISDALSANAADPSITVAQGMFPNDPDAEKKVNDLDEAIRALTGQRAYISRKTGFGAAKADNAPEQVQISTDYTMSSAAFATLSGNVRNLFVESMNGAIQETIGEGVANSVDNIRQMTQLQSIILANAYAKRVNEVLPKPGTEGYVQGGYLSREQQAEVFKSLMPLSPFIEGNNQIYYIAGSDKMDVSNTIPYGASLNDKVSAAPTVNAPANAGVKGIATMVIGNGDGKTIQLTSQDPKNTERAVFIFDGINFPLDYTREGSRAANKAALEAVLGNPMANALKSFQATVSELTGKVDSYLDFNDEFKMELAKVIHGPAVEKEIADALTPADLLSYASQLDRSARNDAAWIEARHAVLNQVNLGMDQMAAAGAPYTVDNKVQLSGSMEEISTQLNTMLDAELTKAKARFDAESEVADIKRRDKKISVATDVAGFGIEQPSGVRIVAGDALASVLGAVSREIPRYQSAALQTAIKNLVAEGYKVVHGTYDQLVAYNESLGANAIDMSGVDQFSDQGLTNPHSREIWLLNPTAEVLVHEAIHASTFMSLLSHYNGEGAVSPSVAGSIEAIEGLMNQFLELDQVDLAPYRDAVAAINGALNNSSLSLAERKAQAVNEYMAWGLANKELAQAQAKVPVSITTLVWETIQKVRNWLFGNTGRNTDDMLSNLVFHTKVIMGETQPTLSTVSNTNTLMMSSYGKNQRMADLSRMIQKKVGQYVNTGTRIQAAKSKTVATKASINAFHMRGLFAANGFPMSMEESATFHKIVAILGTQVQLDSGVMTRLQELYAAVTKDMTVETFMDDPQSTNPNDFAAAQQRFDVVMGKKGIGKDTMGRSTLLPSFVALALTNDRFRKILADMPVPRTEQSNQARTVDAWLENTANTLLDKMGDLVSGQKTAPNIGAAIDSLADQLMSIEKETAGFYAQQLEAAGSLSDRANDRIVKGMSQLGEKLGKTAEARKAAGKNATLLDSLANNSLTLASSILSEERAGFVAEAAIAGINSAKLPKWLHDILADMIGRVDSNANVYDLIKKVRSSIQRVRNQFRTELPKTLAKHFTRPVTGAEWALMNSAIGKTDLVSLVLSGRFTRKEAINVLTGQTALNKAIRAAELEVVQMAGRNGNEMLSRSSQLAKFMMTGIPGQNLARNANAIARRLGMRNPAQSLDKALAERIDALTTLYAVDLLTDAQKSGMAALIREQAAGVDFVFDYAQAMSQEEIAREKNSLMGQATYNRYKGHMPQLAQEGVSLVIASDSEYAKLAERSYIRIGGYNTSSLEANGAAMGYYYAPVSGRAQFNQGILQNVRQTVGGVDNLTGYTVGSLTAGRIIDPAQVKKIAALQAAGRYVEGGTNLMPVFSPSGVVVAYERSADPRALASLNHSENYAELLGVWKGRLAEEMLAEESNTVAVEQLAEMYRKDMNKSSLNKSQYVNLFDMGFQGKNPVLVDALKLFTPSTVDLINASFPNGEFWVRKDMLDNVIGYRSATVGDAWTGNSYWSSQTQENIRKVAMTVFGNKAFQYMVNAESLLQGVVQDARTLIVVKSMVVPLANFMSNLLQLIARGVPVRSIVAGMPKKLAEVRQYVAAEKRAIEAEAELHAATDPIKQRRLRVEIQSIRDSFKRMSIYPLIERGELSSMSDDAQPEDQELTAGRLSQFIEAQVNKLPPAIRTAGKYALITKDTALYKGLRKSVEYGDFLAKAIMWDDFTQRQGKTPEYAGSKITEEFVNYDRLGGRNRQYLEDVGLMWFYNFKIRSAKVALSMMRNNPLHVLMAAAVPVPGVFGSVGSPITDNVLSKMMEGSLDSSLGLDQLFAAPMLHPIENLVF